MSPGCSLYILLEGWVHRRDHYHHNSHTNHHHLWSPTQTNIPHGRLHGAHNWGTWRVLAGSHQIVPGTPCKLVHFPALVQVDLLPAAVLSLQSDLLSLQGGSLSILPNASALLLDRMCVHRQVVFTADGLPMRSLVPTRANPGAQAGRGTKSPVTWTLVGCIG